MAEIFKKIGSMVLSLLMLVSFTGILMERDFCIPCGAESEEVYFFAPLLESSPNVDCHCHNLTQETADTDECCSSHPKEHTDIVNFLYARFSTTFLQNTISFLSKPLVKVIAVILNSNNTSHHLISKSLFLKSSILIKAPPNNVSQSITCQYLI